MIGNKLGVLVCLWLATMVSSPAMAADWLKLGVDESGHTWFVDTSTIHRDGGIVQVWSKVEFAQPKTDPSIGKLIFAASYLQVTNCLEPFTGLKKVKLFTASGELISEHALTVYSIPRPVVSGPFFEEINQLICAPATASASPANASQ